MPINANVTNNQITATVGETKIDVSVSGGFGPTGPQGPSGSQGASGVVEAANLAALPGTGTAGVIYVTLNTNKLYRWSGSTYVEVSAGASAWSDITGKPTFGTAAAEDVEDFAAAVHQHAWSDITSGVPSEFAPSAHAASHGPGGADELFDQSLNKNDTVEFAGVLVGNITATYAANFISIAPFPASASSFSITFGDSTIQTTAWTGSVAAEDVTGLSLVATSNDYADLENLPILGTAALENVEAFAAASHSHAASAITSGTLDASRLPISGVSAGTYGSASSVATYTVDATGRLTAAGSTAIAISAGAVSGLASVATAGTFASLTSRPTTLSGYGITDAVSSSDSRLTDTRTPTAGSVTDSSITSGGLSTSVLNWAAIQPWAANTAYAKGDLVSNAGIAYRRSVAGTSGATFNAANWQQITPSEFVGSQITSGTIAAARLGSGTADATTFLRGDNSWATPTASVSYATTAQSQDLTATTAAINPANLRTALASWTRVNLPSTYTLSGGSVATNNSPTFVSLISNTTANGAAAVYLSQPVWSSSKIHQGYDWSLPATFYCRVYRQQCPSTGVLRYLFGQLASSGFAYETLSGRGIGFEIRQSRIWLLAHNGTALTSADTGINAAASDFSGNMSEIVVRSDGAGNVTITHSLAGASASTFTTTGGPTTSVTSAQPTAYIAVSNGGTASQTWFLATPHLVSVP